MSKISLKKLNLRRLNLKLFKRLPSEEKRLTVSTWFTITRIVLTPFVVAAMIFNYWGSAFFLFVAASATDIIDGNIARWFDEKTFLGACLDPIADKVLLISCFATLAFVQSPLFAIPLWLVLLVLIKDTTIIFGGLVIYLYQGHLEVHPTILGKLTTFVQSCFIIWLFACCFFQWLPIKTYYTMLSVISLLMFSSLVQYVTIGLSQWIGSSK